jgi:hypothetical protein
MKEWTGKRKISSKKEDNPVKMFGGKNCLGQTFNQRRGKKHGQLSSFLKEIRFLL